MCLQKLLNLQSLLCPSKSVVSYNVSNDLLKAYSQMADRRKLQGEIDRCLKKVTEGVEIFEDLWQKIQSATNFNIKDKHEADLKKEIKKLQRLRDTIKTWLATSEIKDKNILLEYKRLIEVQMERFKIIERETKTKAYSKEGLGAATKVDPKEKEKEDITAWLSRSIDELNLQIDQFESEIESVDARKKKDRDKQDQVDFFQIHRDKHQHHVDKLETIMRLIDNDALPLGQILKIKDDVEFYIGSSRESDFEENEFLYDDLKLEEACAALGSKLAAMSCHDNDDNISDSLSLQNSSSPSPSPSIASHSKDLPDEDHRTKLKSQSDDLNHSSRSSSSSLPKQHNNNLSSSSSSNANTVNTGSSSNSTGKISLKTSVRLSTTSLSSLSPDAQGSGSVTTPTSLHQNYAQAASINHSSMWTPDKTNSWSSGDHNQIAASSALSGNAPSVNAAASSSAPNSSAKEHHQTYHFAAGLKLSTNSASPSPSPRQRVATALSEPILELLQAASIAGRYSPQPQQPSNGAGLQHPFSRSSSATAGVVESKQACLNGPSSAGATSSTTQSTTRSELIVAVTTKRTSQSSSLPADTSPTSAVSAQTPLLVNVGSSYSCTLSSPGGLFHQQSSLPSSSSYQLSDAGPPVAPPFTATIHLESILGVAPLGPQPLDREHAFQLMMLDAGSHHLPLSMDSQRVRPYFPSSPCPVPPHYTQLHPSVANSTEFFQRLQPETLFFVFYYMEGTKAQNLAAKALKLLSWRFHMKYLMWFQRHEEPKVITEDFEQGTYIYFDYEKWTQRKKEGFVFEYKYLEDLG